MTYLNASSILCSFHCENEHYIGVYLMFAKQTMVRRTSLAAPTTPWSSGRTSATRDVLPQVRRATGLARTKREVSLARTELVARYSREGCGTYKAASIQLCSIPVYFLRGARSYHPVVNCQSGDRGCLKKTMQIWYAHLFVFFHTTRILCSYYHLASRRHTFHAHHRYYLFCCCLMPYNYIYI